MPKVLQSRNGYYLVYGWEHLLTYKHITSYREMEAYKGTGMTSAIALSSRIKKLEIPDDFYVLGVEGEDTELGYQQTVYWARRGYHHYVGIET